MRIPLNPRQIRIWLAGLFLICFLYFPPRAFNWAENARLDLTLALVNQGTIAIDAYRQNTGDIALYGGHIYSNKAPGLSLLAVPVYAVHKALFEPFHGAPSFDNFGLPTPSGQLDSYTDMLLYLETIYTVAIPSVLFLLLFFWFLGYFSASLGNRLLLTLALGLGTMVFPYSRVFYAHVPTAGLLFTGFALVYIAARPDSGRGVWSNSLAGHPQGTAALAGLALGAAVLFEYPAALGSLLITAYAALCLSRRQLLFLLAGSALPLLVLMGYHLAAYHNPFSAGYGAYTVNWRQETEGFHGLT